MVTTSKPVDDSIDRHYNLLIDDIKKGLLVPVLGGDINLCGRPQEARMPIKWGIKYPPSTCELASYLLGRVPKSKLDPDLHDLLSKFLEKQVRNPQDSMSAVCLANVCQYIQLIDRSILDGELPQLLEKEYIPTPVHEFLLELAQYNPSPAIAYDRPYPCIVTACFDQVLEQLLQSRKVPFHLVAFVLTEQGGVFEYTPPGKKPVESSQEINSADMPDLMDGLKEHAVVIKLNGGFPVGKRNFAITEDHYIDYLSHQGIKDSLPEMLLAKLTKRGKKENSHLLFLGYSLRHWNLRVILRRIWSENLRNMNKRWTVVMEQRFSSVDARFWAEYGLPASELKQIDSLDRYIHGLTEKLKYMKRETFSMGGIGLLGSNSSEPTLRQEMPKRDGVFISYSHKDEKWLLDLLIMLSPVKNKLKLWSDRDIHPGAEWREEIATALASARAALLLVTPDFLSSDFIQKDELPQLLDAAKKAGCKILWLKVKESLVNETSIAKYQALNREPLINLTEGGINRALRDVGEEILKELASPVHA